MQSAVQDHCQDCTGGQSLSDHHTFFDKTGTTTSLMTVRPNTVLSFTLLIAGIWVPDKNFFWFFPQKSKDKRKKGIVNFLEAINKP